MNSKIALFCVVFLLVVIPSASGQEIDVVKEANQESVKVTIDERGNVHVKHIIMLSDSTTELDLIEGIVENLMVIDEEGKKQMFTISENDNSTIILPPHNNSIVEYDLKQVFVENNNIRSWDFRYIQTTHFLFPEELDLVFVNNRPINLEDKRGFACHGCQMILEYSPVHSSKLNEVHWEDKKFLVEIHSFANINDFEFEQATKKISFNINDNSQFAITVTTPLELLWGPYVVFQNDEKIPFQELAANGTHSQIILQPNSTGEITIIGTTVIPEFPIISPLAIGFLTILIVPLIRKINLH